jgi:hypothetical protein
LYPGVSAVAIATVSSSVEESAIVVGEVAGVLAQYSVVGRDPAIDVVVVSINSTA